MILPTKRIRAERSLLGIGAEVLRLLQEPKTVSRLWDEHQRLRSAAKRPVRVTYDMFVLTLDLLFAMGTIEIVSGLVRRRRIGMIGGDHAAESMEADSKAVPHMAA